MSESYNELYHIQKGGGSWEASLLHKQSSKHRNERHSSSDTMHEDRRDTIQGCNMHRPTEEKEGW